MQTLQRKLERVGTQALEMDREKRQLGRQLETQTHRANRFKEERDAVNNELREAREEINKKDIMTASLKFQIKTGSLIAKVIIHYCKF